MSSRGSTATRAPGTSAKATKAAQAQAATRTATRQAQRTVSALERLNAARARNPNAYTGARTIPASELSAAVRPTLARELPKMAPMLAERRIIVDPATGRILLDKTGKANKEGEFNGVNLRAWKSEQYPHGERAVARGMVDIHNHPFLRDSYPTVNDWDYEEASRWVKPQSIGALTEHGFAFIRPKGGEGAKWPSYATTVKPALDRHFAAIDQQLAKAIRAGRIPAGATEGDIMHLAWRRAARDTGLTYTRVPMAGVTGGRGSGRGGRAGAALGGLLRRTTKKAGR